jgi:hypothetical protein
MANEMGDWTAIAALDRGISNITLAGLAVRARRLTDEQGGLLQQIVRRESTGRSRVCRGLTTVARQLVTVTGEGLERDDLPDPVKGMLDRLA